MDFTREDSNLGSQNKLYSYFHFKIANQIKVFCKSSPTSLFPYQSFCSFLQTMDQ